MNSETFEENKSDWIYFAKKQRGNMLLKQQNQVTTSLQNFGRKSMVTQRPVVRIIRKQSDESLYKLNSVTKSIAAEKVE